MTVGLRYWTYPYPNNSKKIPKILHNYLLLDVSYDLFRRGLSSIVGSGAYVNLIVSSFRNRKQSAVVSSNGG